MKNCALSFSNRKPVSSANATLAAKGNVERPRTYSAEVIANRAELLITRDAKALMRLAAMAGGHLPR